jgi:purine-cytosine permease-like protein
MKTLTTKVLVRRESEIGIRIAQLTSTPEREAMTTIERWTKGILSAIGMMLVMALLQYLNPLPPPSNPFPYGFAAGLMYFTGWFACSAAERNIRLTS